MSNRTPGDARTLVDIELDTTADFKQLSVRGRTDYRHLGGNTLEIAEDLKERLGNMPTKQGTRSRRLLTPHMDAAIRARIVAGYLVTAHELLMKVGWLHMKAYSSFLKHFVEEVEAAQNRTPAKTMTVTEV